MRSLRGIVALVLVVFMTTSAMYANSASSVPTRVGNQLLRWRTNTIKVAVSTSLTQPNFNIKNDSEVIDALKKSFHAWEDASDVTFEWEFTDRTNVSPVGISGDGVSLITIAPTAENALVFGREAESEAVKTRVFYSAKGFITEADIVLNPYQLFSTDGTFGTYDLESALTHEIGHLLGLRHSSVMGSTMSGRFSKNGLFGMADLGMRSLDESDVSAVRELYGAADDDLCCAAVTGRVGVSPRASRAVQVWAEDQLTGRVAGIGEVNSDGTFRIAGLPASTYSVYVQRREDLAGSTVESLGTVTLENGQTGQTTDRPAARRGAMDVRYLGVNGQLADSAVQLAKGQEYTLYLGGTDMDLAALNIETASESIKVDPMSFSSQQFGDGMSAIGFRVQVSDTVKPGTYSLFVSRSDGSRTALIGALRVE